MGVGCCQSWTSPLQKELCAELGSWSSWGEGDAVAAGYSVPLKGHGLVRTTQQRSSEAIMWCCSPHGMAPTSSPRSSGPACTLKTFWDNHFYHGRGLCRHIKVCALSCMFMVQLLSGFSLPGLVCREAVQGTCLQLRVAVVLPPFF